MLSYLHPIFAGLTLATLAYVAALGAQIRREPRRSMAARRRHARLAPWVYGAMLASFAGGWISVETLRPESAAPTDTHFRIGLALVVLLTGSTLTAQRLRHPLARSAHPWLGVAAVLVAAAQVFFGLQIMP